jgi:hypothetical protein
MGNDDVMCPGALANVADVINRNPDVGFVLKSYLFSDQSAGHFKKLETVLVRQAVRVLSRQRLCQYEPR